MSDTDSKAGPPILCNVDKEILDRFEGRVLSIEFVHSARKMELRTILHLAPPFGETETDCTEDMVSHG